MFNLEQMIFYVLATLIIIVLPLLTLFKLERKWDQRCLVVGYYTCMVFFYLVIFSLSIGKFELVPTIISSLVIALLTLALTWVELSKRPELKLLDFIPITHVLPDTIWKVGFNVGQLSTQSRFLKIREACGMKITIHSSFSVDLANVGYGEIMVHEYVYYVDGRSQTTKGLVSESNAQERLILKTQQRHTINIPRLYIRKPGFHKLRLDVSASTIRVSQEVWFFISEDLQKLNYVEIHPLKLLFSPIIKAKLKNFSFSR